MARDKAPITWNTTTLYEPPELGVCEISGAYEPGRWYDRGGKRIFVGNSAAPEAVEDYLTFATMVGTVEGFKRGYPKKDRVAERLPAPKKKKAAKK
jgi:hypothetical protein